MKKRKAVRGERKTAGRLFAVKILQLADISAQRLFIEYDAVRKIYSETSAIIIIGNAGGAVRYSDGESSVRKPAGGLKGGNERCVVICM